MIAFNVHQLEKPIKSFVVIALNVHIYSQGVKYNERCGRRISNFIILIEREKPIKLSLISNR